MENTELENEIDGLEQPELCDEAITSPRTLTLDVKKYEHFFEDEDYSDQQKQDYLQALWSILVTFIHLGVEVRPVAEDCGKPTDRNDLGPDTASTVVRSKSQNLNSKFVRAVDQEHDPATERIQQ